MELLRNAWTGWQDYMEHGKLAALFFLGLLYLALSGRKREAETAQIRNYGITAAVLCIFPPAAAVLMYYQTRFYNYEWVWSIVPVTIVIALSGTLFLTEQWEGHKNNKRYNIALAAAVAGILLLSGRLGAEPWARGTQMPGREAVERILDAAAEREEGEEVCLWAPREILEYARAADGGVTLLYGRNMWDNALNAYSYDQYSAETEALYQWMEQTAQTGEWVHETERGEPGADGSEQIELALRLGADRILLRDNLSEDARSGLETLADAAHLEIQQTEGYYLLKKR